MKIFLDSRFEIESVEDKLENMIVKGSNDFDAISVYVPTSLVSSYSTIYPKYAVKRADGRNNGFYEMTSVATSVDGYYGWKGTFHARDLAVAGPLQITLSFTLNNMTKNVAMVTCNVSEAVDVGDGIYIIDNGDIQSMVAAIDDLDQALDQEINDRTQNCEDLQTQINQKANKTDVVNVKTYHNQYSVVSFTDFNDIQENCMYAWGDSGAITNVLNKPSNLDANADTLFYCYEMKFTTIKYYIQIIMQGDITYKRAMSTSNNEWDNWEEIKTGQKIFNCGASDNLPNLINKARRYKNSILYVQGTHDLVTEMSGNYGIGLLLDNNIHVIFSSNAKVTFNYTGSDTAFQQAFSVFNTSTLNDAGYTLENVNIECSNIRYAVHDDIGSYTKPYNVRFINCNFKIDNSGTSYLDGFHQCIGGGLGAYEYVEIDNCIFNSVGISSLAYTSDNHAEVSYHNTGLSYGKSKIYVKNSYFTEGGFLITNYGTSTDISTAYVNNCSFKYKAWCNNYSEFTANVDLVEYNNKTRESLLWENSNPTSDMGYTSNVINQSALTPYNYIKILYKNHKSHTSATIIKTYYVLTDFNINCTFNMSYGADTFSRSLVGNSNGIKFTDCVDNQSQSENARLIPIAIYGGIDELGA